MNLHRLLGERQAERGRPAGVGVIGCGKFAAMFLAQAHRVVGAQGARGTPGLHVVAIADLDLGRARENLRRIGWPPERLAATASAGRLAATASAGRLAASAAVGAATTWLTEDANALINAPDVEVVIEATGDPAAGIAHALAAIAAGKHLVMVNVEADVLAGPLLARRAAAAGVIYSLAYGDQPALICEQVDWARTCGFEVIGAGKGTKYLPAYHASTPETVWGHYGLTPERARAAGMNPKMFNSFLDGTKSAIEMAAVANATGLTPQPEGLNFPPCGVHDLARVCRPRADGGQLAHAGAVEVVSSLERDGRPVAGDLRWGTWVSFRAPDDYVQSCFADYGLITDDSGRYSALWRPYHLIGLELGVSVASIVCRNEATGSATGFQGDVAATAKRDLAAGEILDGEGGATVYGKLMPAAASLAQGALPLGLANNVKLLRPIAAGGTVGWADVAMDANQLAVRVRREMEQLFIDRQRSAAE